MGTSRTESYEGCLQTQFKHLPPQLALKFFKAFKSVKKSMN